MLKFPHNKNVFLKLYRYYCTKLLSKIGLVFFYLLIIVFMLIIQGFSLRKVSFNGSGQQKLAAFWLVSFFQLLPLIQMMNPLISYLTGRGLGGEELKKKQFFQVPKISREEDIKVLIFTPSADRETVIGAKFAAAFTYFVGINFFLTLFGFIYCLFFTNFGIISSFLFLFLNGIILVLVNFLLSVPFLFYQQEEGSFLAFFYLFILLIIVTFSGFFLRNIIQQYPVIFILAFVPLSAVVAYLFFSLYGKKYLKKDLG